MRGTAWLEARLGEGPQQLGQIWIAGGALRHIDDRDAAEGSLAPLADLAALRETVKTDDGGNFRPLRGAPTLRRGWRSPILAAPALARWLNVLYPGALAFAELGGALPVTPFEETARRQTGMYRLLHAATPEQARRTIEEVCDAGCLRQRLWSGGPARAEGLPLLCPEACNYFVGRCRESLAAARA
ncbi:MAG: DR2241 family protein [Verrucomicrobium sp.]|nr:DR2241 family protein [Verrucomicrobium sp.]